MNSGRPKQPLALPDPKANADKQARGMHLAVISLAALYLFVYQAWPTSFPTIMVKTSWPIAVTIVAASSVALAIYIIMRNPRPSRKA
jgi:hypothetical protein